MESDVKIGLFFAAAIAVACGSTRISFRGGDAPAEKIAPAVVSVKPADPVISLPTPSPATETAEKIAQTKPAEEKAKTAQDALAKLFPKDLRKKADEASEKVSEAKDDLVLDLDDPLALADKEQKSKGKSETATPPASASEKNSKPISKANSPDKLEMPKFEDDLLADIADVQEVPDDAIESLEKASSGSNSPKRLPEPDPDPAQLGKADKGPVHPYFERFLESGNYYVREGDSLRDIAYNLYQDESRADEILKLNKSVLKKASDLRPGMRLKLPR